VVVNNKFKLLIFLACGLALTGCGSRAEGLLTLKRVGDSQEEIERYLQRQERLFNKLAEDIKNKKLKAGISKRKITGIYGEPVLSKQPSDSLTTVFLYRHPTKYFSSDKVYLYFDESGELSSWKYIPRAPAAE